MKNFVLFLIISLSLVSCEDHEINEFAMQAKIGDRFFTSIEARASLAGNGKLVIQGSRRLESLTLTLSRLKVGEFNIGQGFSNSAVFSDVDGNLYEAKPNGSGLVTITEINQDSKTLSGTFNFSAIRPGIDTVFVSKGFLYNIPYGGGDINNPEDAGTLTAKVDGEPFLPSVVSARGTGSSIAIFGSSITSTIAISVPVNVVVGEYQLPQNGFSAKYQNEAGTQTTTGGTIKITEHVVATKSIKGTFSFTTNRSQITEGQFEVTYL